MLQIVLGYCFSFVFNNVSMLLPHTKCAHTFQADTVPIPQTKLRFSKTNFSVRYSNIDFIMNHTLQISKILT